MPGNDFEKFFVNVKVIGVNTSNEKISGGIRAVNNMLEKNFSGVNYFAVDRNDTANLAACKCSKWRKFRLLDAEDEKTLTENLNDADLIFIAADEVWENLKLAALTAHCAKKSGATVIFIAGGNFEDAEDEIIFDALIKLPSKNFEFDAGKVIENFIEMTTLEGQPNIDVKIISDAVKNSGAIVGYGERDGKNAVLKAAKAALEHAENSADNFKTAEKIFFNVTAARGNISLEEAEKLAELLKRRAPKVEIFFGFSINDWLGDKVKFLIIATQPK